jgi:hypothetical protein
VVAVQSDERPLRKHVSAQALEVVSSGQGVGVVEETRVVGIVVVDVVVVVVVLVVVC